MIPFLSVLQRVSPRCRLTLLASSVEPDQPGDENEELPIRSQAGLVQPRRSSSHLQLSDLPLDPRGDRRGARLLLRLPHHDSPLGRLLHNLPGKVLRGQGVQEVETWTEADPLPHLGNLPDHNSAP